MHLYREGCSPCTQLDSLLALWLPSQDSLHYERRDYTKQDLPADRLPSLLLYAPDGAFIWKKSGYQAYEWVHQLYMHFWESRLSARYDSASTAMTRDWQEALKAAKRSGQLLLVWLTHPECHACKQLFVETWLEQTYRLRLQPYFLPYLVDISKDTERYFRRLLNYRSFPALFIVDDKERKQAEITGYLPPAMLSDSLLNTLANLDAAALFNYEQNYKAALRKAKNSRRPLVWAVIGEKDCTDCEEAFKQYIRYAPLRDWSRRHAVASYFLFRQLPERHKLRLLNEERPFVLLLNPEGTIIEVFSPCPPAATLYDRLRNR